MGHRLSKIYTRTGDNGSTGLGDGSRVEKDDVRVEAYGTVDELNSHIGVVLAYELPESVKTCLETIQHKLFELGGELSIPGRNVLTQQHVDYLEKQLDEFNETLPYLTEFILPAGGLATSQCHVARTVCRRAERRACSLRRESEVNPYSLVYLNRLSDLLFVVARVCARYENGKEVLWQPE